MELIDGVGFSIEAVHKIGCGRGEDRLFASVAYMFDCISGCPLFLNLTFLPIQPFQSHLRLVDSGPSPTLRWFHGNLVWFHMVFAPVEITRTGNSHALFKWVKACIGLKLLHKFLATCFEKDHVRLAIIHHLAMKIKHIVSGHLICMPQFQFFTLLDIHTIRIVVL